MWASALGMEWFGQNLFGARILIFVAALAILALVARLAQQEFRSALTESVRGFFVNSSVDWFVTGHYVLGGGFNILRGKKQSYDQAYFSLGYVF